MKLQTVNTLASYFYSVWTFNQSMDEDSLSYCKLNAVAIICPAVGSGLKKMPSSQKIF